MEEDVYINFKNGEAPYISDVTLNQMQKLIKADTKDSGVVVSSTEPTENNRKKVWIQHSKNLYREQEVMNGLWSSSGVVGNNGSGWYVVVPIRGENTYTISRKKGKADNSNLSLIAFTTNVYPAANATIIDSIVSDSANGKQVTIETTLEANYLFIGVAAGNVATVTEEVQNLALEELQVEIGDSATEYEAPVENDILVKENEGYNSISPKTIKILDTTNTEYNIRVRAYKCGKVITVTLYTTTLAKQISQGQQSIILGQLGEENGPLENFIVMLSSAYGQRFSIQCNSNGNIYISYAYSNVATPNQIAQMVTYIAK